MFSIFNQFKKETKKLEPTIDIDNIEFACAVLLVESALMDQEFGKDEKIAIENILKKQFSLDNEITKELISEATKTSKETSDLVTFTRKIKNSWDLEKRIKIIEMMWEVVLIDEVLSPYEDMLIRRVAGLIYISDKERGLAKKRAELKLNKDKDKKQ